MQELTKILAKEQEEKNKIEEAQKEANLAIEAKRQELAEKLSKTEGLTTDEKEKFLTYKKEKMNEIEKDATKDLNEAKAGLSLQKKNNFKKAVNCVVDELLNS